MQTNSRVIIIVAIIVGFLVILFTLLQAQQDSYEQEIARIQTQQANREDSGPCPPDGSIYNSQTNRCVYAGNLAEPKEPVR